MLRVGLVGVGGISGAHIPAWEAMEDVELVALCDVRPGQMKKYPAKRRYVDFDEMLEKETLDILDICLPTYLHADFAVKAMERGINVICEKPISLKQEDVDRVYSTALKMNVKFMAAQVVRFWPEYLLLKELYDNGRFGRLLSGYMRRLGSIPGWSWDNWMKDEKRSGLIPYDLHIHDLDFMVYTFGRPKNAFSRRVKRPEQDYLSVIYDFEDFSVTAECSWYAGSYPFGAGFRFQFEKAVVEYAGGKFMIYHGDGTVEDLTDIPEGDTGKINLPKSNAYADEIRYFTDCVKEDRFPDKIKPKELSTVIDILNFL